MMFWEPFVLDAPSGADEFFATLAMCDSIPISNDGHFGGVNLLGGMGIVFSDFLPEDKAYRFANTLILPKMQLAKKGRVLFERELESGITFIDDKQAAQQKEER